MILRKSVFEGIFKMLVFFKILHLRLVIAIKNFVKLIKVLFNLSINVHMKEKELY